MNDTLFNPLYYLSMDDLDMRVISIDFDINSILNGEYQDTFSSITLHDPDSDYSYHTSDTDNDSSSDY